MAYRASTLSGVISGSGLIMTLPTNVANDIIIAIIITRAQTATLSINQGWTIVAGPTNFSTLSRAWIAYKRSSGSEATPTATFTGDITSNKYALLASYSGAVTSGDPFDTTWSTNTGNAQNGSTTGITTATANAEVILAMIEQDNVVTAATVTATDPASFTQDVYTTTATGADAGAGFWSAVRTSAGATGTVNHNMNAVPDGWHSFLNALKPEPTGVTVNITGVSSASAVGNVSISKSVAITNVSATGTVGNTGVNTNISISGVEVTGNLGNVTPATSVNLSGVSSTGEVGTVTIPPEGTAITGVESISAVGSVGTSREVAITGVSAVGAVGNVVPGKMVEITGNSAVGAVNSVSITRDITLAGVSAAGVAGNITPALSLAITGVSTTGGAGGLPGANIIIINE